MNVTDRQTDRPWNSNIDRNKRNRVLAMSPKTYEKLHKIDFSVNDTLLSYCSYLQVYKNNSPVHEKYSLIR